VITSSIRGKVHDYIDGVLDGSLVVSCRVRDAVQRHVDDLEKQSQSDFPYHFDSRHAEMVCQFFPLLLRHSIGEFARQPFELSPFQLFCTWVMFGWKRDGDGSRRFRKIYISLARKNGKSSWVSGLCHFLAAGDVDPATGKPEAVGQILLTATKKEQADVVYSEIERMRLQSPALLKMSNVKYETITYKHNSSYIRKVGSDKPFDGLNPHAVITDELHAWQERHRPFYDTMVTGSGSRTQPLHLIITTAGDDSSHLWLAEYNYACSVMQGTIKDETLFAFICELDETDDPGDESKWVKANPNLGVSVKLDYLRQRWAEDQHTALGVNRFTRYHGNRLVSSSAKAFDLNLWDAGERVLSDWHTADAIGAGVDLGSRDDLAAIGLCARFVVDYQADNPIYRYEVKTLAFIADDCKRDLAQMPFASWLYCGLISKSKYPIADLQAKLIELCQDLGVQTVAYDPYNGQQLGEELSKEGLVAARMAQNQTNFNEPIRDFQQAIVDGRLSHDGNALLRWCVSNAVVSADRSDRWMFDKRSSSEKIDPLVAVLMAFRVASLADTKATGSLYLT